jgi:hypothetical protein
VPESLHSLSFCALGFARAFAAASRRLCCGTASSAAAAAAGLRLRVLRFATFRVSVSIGCGCTASIVHGSLLPLQPAQMLLQIPAPGNRAFVYPALPRVNLQQRPNAATDLAPSSCTDLAGRAVLQQRLHFATIGRWALWIRASAGMHKQLHVQLD